MWESCGHLLTLFFLSFASVLLDTKKKIEKMKHYQDSLMETLEHVLEDHFPLPSEVNASKKKKVKMVATDNIKTYFPLLVNHTSVANYTSCYFAECAARSECQSNIAE